MLSGWARVAVVGLSMLTPGVGRAALIENGSFEEGPNPPIADTAERVLPQTDLEKPLPITGWIVNEDPFNTEFGVDWYAGVWPAPPDGERTLHLNGGGPGSITQGLFDLVQGNVYRLSLQSAAHPGGALPRIRSAEITVAGATSVALVLQETFFAGNPAGIRFRPASWAFTAPAPNEIDDGAGGTIKSWNLTIRSRTDGAYGIVIDDVDLELVAVPAPVAALLLGTGLVGLGWTRHRAAAA